MGTWREGGVGVERRDREGGKNREGQRTRRAVMILIIKMSLATR